MEHTHEASAHALNPTARQACYGKRRALEEEGPPGWDKWKD
jgi:hypothetical protein